MLQTYGLTAGIFGVPVRLIILLLLSCRFSMEVLSGPWADLALLLRQTALLSDQQQDTLVCLLLVVLFLSVSLLLLQLIVYLSWKLRQGEPVITLDCSSPDGPLTLLYSVWNNRIKRIFFLEEFIYLQCNLHFRI